MKRCCELGFCFNCEERYHRNHVYKSPAPLLLLQDVPPSESSDNGDGVAKEGADQVPEEALQVALHALVGDCVTNSIYLQGLIGSMAPQFLVDLGATLSFIHPKWLPRLKLPLNTA